MNAADTLNTAPPTGPQRQRNPRGQGHRLRGEIIAGAAQLIERTGSEHSITLRAVAREIGIAAPSIAPHFADRAEIIDAVVASELEGVSNALREAATGVADPVEALFAAFRAYVAFGWDHPNRYRVIYERRYLEIWDDAQPPMLETGPLMNRTIELGVSLLQACIDAGRSASTDAFADILAIWMLLHGLVTLPSSITSLPWPDTDRTLTESVTLLARIQPAPRRRTKARG